MFSFLKRKVTYVIVASVGILMSVIPARADPYGADAVTDLISGLFNSFWPLIALLFIIGIILGLFTAPWWLKRVFGAVNGGK